MNDHTNFLTVFGTTLALSLLPVLGHGQDPCNDLEVVSITHAAFDPDAVVVELLNNGTFFFNYPTLQLLDAANDTLSQSSLTFFGMANGMHSDQMMATPGAALPASPFIGTLLLTYHLQPDPVNQCEFALNGVDLCPLAPCTELFIYVHSSDQLAGDVAFTWTITDAGQTVVAQGELSVPAGENSTATATACLPPGEYVAHVARPVASAGQFTFGLAQNDFITSGPSMAFVPSSDPLATTDLPFNYYTPCADIHSGIDATEPPAPLIVLLNSTLHVSSSDGSPLGPMALIASTGQLVHTTNTRTNNIQMHLYGKPPGVYLLRSLQPHRPFPTQRFILQ